MRPALNAVIAWSLLAGLGLSAAPAATAEPAQNRPANRIEIDAIRVSRFDFVFATADGQPAGRIGVEQLREQLADLLGQPLDADALQEAAYRLTRWYRATGHVQARVTLPDQVIRDGVVQLRVSEGYLGEIRVEGLERLSPQFVRERLAGDQARPALHLPQLQAALGQLNRHPRIARIDARLLPGLDPDEALLQLDVEEAPRRQFMIGADNHRSPSIGANRLSLEASDLDLSGNRDQLMLRTALSPQPGELGFSYRLPLTAHDTALEFAWSRSDSTALEAPFEDLDLESVARRASIGLLIPLADEAGQSSSLALRLERGNTETRLLGLRYPFSDDSADGLARHHALRLSWDHTTREPQRLSAWRLVASAGRDTLGSREPEADPQRFFASLLGQAQALWQSESGQWLLRANLQWSPGRLASGERFALGGADSVRGYRENLYVRDNGVFASLEYRQAFSRDDDTPSPWQWAVFTDLASGWDRGEAAHTRHLASIGAGLIWQPEPALRGELYWGQRLIQTAAQPHQSLQDAGLHFRLVYRM